MCSKNKYSLGAGVFRGSVVKSAGCSYQGHGFGF